MRRLWLVAALAAASCALNGTINPSPPQDVRALRDASLEVTVDISKGGAITYLNIIDGAQFSGDVVDHGDVTGRELQVSFRRGAQRDCWPCGDATCQSGWNPTQEGSACQVRSGGTLQRADATSVSVDSQPLNWDPKLGTSKLALSSAVTLQAPGILRLDYRAVNHEAFTVGADAWGELPVAYLRPNFTTGTRSDGSTTTSTMVGFRDDHGWVALSRADGWTLALYATGDHLSSIGINAGGAKPTSFLQLWQWLELQPEEAGEATAWLVVGHSLEQVRTRMETLR